MLIIYLVKSLYHVYNTHILVSIVKIIYFELESFNTMYFCMYTC